MVTDLPSRTEALTLLDNATREMAARRPREALMLIEQAIETDPSAATLCDAGVKLLAMAMALGGPSLMPVLARAEMVLIDALALDGNMRLARDALGKVSAILCMGEPNHHPQVAALIRAGDQQFMERRFDEAAKFYEFATKTDPTSATAWKYLGNCFYNQRRYAEAAWYFGRATELNPCDPQAFKFLADALHDAREYDAMWRAVYGAIAANPRYWSAWFMLDRLLAGNQVTTRRFRPRPAVEPNFQTKTMSVDESAPKATILAWMAHAITLAGNAAENMTPFARELAAMTAMNHVIVEQLELSEAGTRATLDPQLLILPELAKRGDLRPLVFVLRYNESFRPEFEAWKQEWAKATGDPIEAVQNFLVRTRLRPI